MTYEYYPEFVYPIEEIDVNVFHNKITLKCKTKNRKEDK